MSYVVFSDENEAREYQKALQAHHDEVHVAGQPRIIDCVCPTQDGRWALTWQDDDAPPLAGEKGSMTMTKLGDGISEQSADQQADPAHWDTGNWEVVDSIDPVQEMIDEPPAEEVVPE